MNALRRVRTDIVGCRACPRLVAHREALAADPPARLAGQRYWARPVPGFGDPQARLLILLMATSGHGGNRTGRVLTGSATGDWVGAALHRAGLASQPTSIWPGDGLRLHDVWAASAVRCPPPQDRPTPEEGQRCSVHLAAEVAALPRLRAVLALGGQAWSAAQRHFDVRPRVPFAHGAQARTATGMHLVASYHPSPRVTNTGRLTRAQLDDVLGRAVALGSTTGA